MNFNLNTKIRMRKILIVLFIFTIYNQNISAQEMFTTPDGKQYKATKTWNFICENYALTGILKTQIAKSDKGGILKIAIDVTDAEMYIGGTVYVYLEDFTIITCTDKGIRQNSGKEAIGFYSFSATEMNRLKASPIKDIRFFIKGKETAFSNKIGNFTAKNKINYFDGYDKTIRNSYETEIEIRSLYQ